MFFDYRTRQINLILINFWEDGYPSGDAAIQLDPWIIKGGLRIDEFIPPLDQEGIDYCEVEPINTGTREFLVNSAIKVIFNNDNEEYGGGAGLRKLLLSCSPWPESPLRPSPGGAKGSIA